jgi:alpha-L-rhamnosidase
MYIGLQERFCQNEILQTASHMALQPPCCIHLRPEFSRWWPPLQPANLQCGFVANPLGVDDLSLRLSWQLQATAFGDRGQAQSAYQILVASSSSILDSDHGDLWDSRKVSSDLSLGIAYAGAPLASEQQAFWKVRVWDQTDLPSAWSSSATWTMGLRGVNDWGARWLCAPPASSLPIFRREFVVKPGLQRAMVYICGLGQYELSANGLEGRQ